MTALPKTRHEIADEICRMTGIVHNGSLAKRKINMDYIGVIGGSIPESEQSKGIEYFAKKAKEMQKLYGVNVLVVIWNHGVAIASKKQEDVSSTYFTSPQDRVWMAEAVADRLHGGKTI